MRKATVTRKTAETDITLELNLDGRGRYCISTSIPFLDHMLSLMAKHGLFDLDVKAYGDLEVDFHHTVEDIGICLGEAIRKALGDMKGVQRYGSSAIPMNESLAVAAIDLSNRPYLIYNVKDNLENIGTFDKRLVPEFFQALTSHSGMTLHLNVPYGTNSHHIIEAIFKAFGRALDEATMISSRFEDIMSTKGEI